MWLDNLHLQRVRPSTGGEITLYKHSSTYIYDQYTHKEHVLSRISATRSDEQYVGSSIKNPKSFWTFGWKIDNGIWRCHLIMPVASCGNILQAMPLPPLLPRLPLPCSQLPDSAFQKKANANTRCVGRRCTARSEARSKPVRVCLADWLVLGERAVCPPYLSAVAAGATPSTR